MTRLVSLILLVCVVVGLVGCNRDPKQASAKYVTVGNRYYEQGKFKEAVLMYKRALQKYLKNGEAYYRLGLADLRIQDAQGAVAAFQRAVSLQPNNTDAMVKLADIYLTAYAAISQRRSTQPKEYLVEADELIKRIQKLDAFEFHRLSGYRRLFDSDPQAALTEFRAAYALRPGDPGVGLMMFNTLAKLNQFPEALTTANQLIEKHKDFAQIYAALYLEYLNRKDLDSAERVLKLRATNNPKDPGVFIALAGHYFGTGRKPEMQAALNTVLSDRKTFPMANLLVGDFYFRIRDFDQAIRLYDEGARLDEKSKPDYQKRMIEALMFQGKRIEAMQLVDSLLKAAPADLDARAMRAALVLQGGKKEELQGAITELQSIVSKMPGNAVVRYNLGRAYLAKQELEPARLQFLEAIKIYPAYLPPRIALAQLYLFKGEYASALRTAEEVLQFDNTNIVAKLIRTSSLIGSGENSQARLELQKVIATNNESRDAIFQLAMLDLKDKRPSEAEAGFNRLSKMNPPDLRGQLGLAQVEVAKGNMEGALKVLADQLAKDPNRSELRLAYANTAVRAQKFDVAVTEYKRLIESQPKSSDLYMRLGQALRFGRNYDEASKVFEQARAINPNDAGPLLELALISEEAGRPDDARPLYEKVLKIVPDNPPALNNLAYRLAESGQDLDQALTYAQRARAKVPPSSALSDEIADTLGWIYIKKNLADNAISIFKDLLSRKPTNATWRYHLAMALYQKGDRVQAKKECETALKTAQPGDKTKIQQLMSRIG